MENNNQIYANDNNQVPLNETKKNIKLLYVIIILLLVVLGGTFAYYAFSASNTAINGSAGTVELSLTVNKVLPTTDGIDDILVINHSELASSLNSNCIDEDGEFALCQLYKVTLVNDVSGVNAHVKGSVSFNNTTTPNLSWILLGNTYSSSTNYTSSMLGNTINTASSTFANFENDYLITAGTSIDYYILVWVNETEGVQTDEGTYSGIVRFEDTNGKGVTSKFSS